MKSLNLLVVVLVIPGCASWNSTQFRVVRPLAQQDLKCPGELELAVTATSDDGRASRISARGCEALARYKWYPVDEAWALDGDVQKTGKPDRDPAIDAVAFVDGRPIERKLLDAEVQKLLGPIATIPGPRLLVVKRDVLKRLIASEVLQQAFVAHKIKVSQAQLDQAFATYKTQFANEKRFANYLKQGRVTIESLRERLRHKIATEMLVAQRVNLTISAQQVAYDYKRNRSHYDLGKAVHARHILIKVAENASAADLKRAQKKIKMVGKKLKKGLDFAEAAKRFSEGPLANKGGDLGFFSKGRMVRPFEAAAFALRKGQVSPIVQTRFGLHLIKAVDIRPARLKPLSEVADEIRRKLWNKRFFEERRKLLAALIGSSRIEKLGEFAEP